MAMNESFFPALANSITAMFDLLSTEGCSFQPSDFKAPR
jgi:hypothetical protein